MTSSLGLSSIDSDNFNSSDNSKWNVNFDDRILKLYAQEIEDNQINEIIEAQLQNISVENSFRTAKEIINKFNLSQKKPVPPPRFTSTSKFLSRSMENQISEFKSKVNHIKQNISEETKEQSNSNQIKPIGPPRVKKNLGAIPKISTSNHTNEILAINAKANLFKKPQLETKIKNLTKSLIFNSIGNSTPISETVPCTAHSSQFYIKETGQLFPKISNSPPVPNMANTEITQTADENDDKGYMGLEHSSLAITPPSLPSRPQPVYKYIPGTFSKIDENSVKTLNQAFSTFEQSQNSCSQKNEFSIDIHRKEHVSNKGNVFSSALHKDVPKISLPYTNQKDKDRVSQIQPFSAVDTEGGSVKALKLAIFSEKTNEKNEPLALEKSSRIRNNDINTYENCNSSVLVSEARQIMKKPEVPKKPPKQAIQKRMEQILTKQLHLCGEIQVPDQNYEATKLQNNIPSNHMRSDTDLQDNFDNVDCLKTDMTIINGRIAEITFFDKDKMTKIVGQNSSSDSKGDKMKKVVGQNSSSERKGSLSFERKISNEDSPVNHGIDGQKEKQRKTPQQNLSDLDSIFDSITRPELPQKLKTTQRSVSYSSLVQTFRDFSVALWNPPLDKDKRASVGDISIPNENKDVESGNVEPIIRNRNSVSSNEDGVSCKRRISDLEQGAVNRFSWFHDVKISEANQRLLELGQDGAFLIRPSSKPTVDIPYTASVMLSGKIFNIHIRYRADRQYAIGKEKEGEKTFSSVSDMVKYHQDVPFEICLSRNATHNIYFRVTPPR